MDINCVLIPAFVPISVYKNQARNNQQKNNYRKYYESIGLGVCIEKKVSGFVFNFFLKDVVIKAYLNNIFWVFISNV